MRVELRQSGGFAGLDVVRVAASESLPADQAARLAELVAAAGVFALPARLAARRPGADRFVYELTVEDGPRRHVVVMDEAAVPAAVAPLLEWMRDRAAPVESSAAGRPRRPGA